MAEKEARMVAALAWYGDPQSGTCVVLRRFVAERVGAEAGDLMQFVAAVERYQADLGLVVDGQAGTATLTRMFGMDLRPAACAGCVRSIEADARTWATSILGGREARVRGAKAKWVVPMPPFGGEAGDEPSSYAPFAGWAALRLSDTDDQIVAVELANEELWYACRTGCCTRIGLMDAGGMIYSHQMPTHIGANDCEPPHSGWIGSYHAGDTTQFLSELSIGSGQVGLGTNALVWLGRWCEVPDVDHMLYFRYESNDGSPSVEHRGETPPVGTPVVRARRSHARGAWVGGVTLTIVDGGFQRLCRDCEVMRFERRR